MEQSPYFPIPFLIFPTFFLCGGRSWSLFHFFLTSAHSSFICHAFRLLLNVSCQDMPVISTWVNLLLVFLSACLNISPLTVYHIFFTGVDTYTCIYICSFSKHIYSWLYTIPRDLLCTCLVLFVFHVVCFEINLLNWICLTTSFVKLFEIAFHP